MVERTIDKKQKQFGFGIMGIGVLAMALSLLTKTSILPELHLLISASLWLACGVLITVGTRKLSGIAKEFSLEEGTGAIILFCVLVLVVVCFLLELSGIILVIAAALFITGVFLPLSKLTVKEKQYRWVNALFLIFAYPPLFCTLRVTGNGATVMILLIIYGALMLITGLVFLLTDFSRQRFLSKGKVLFLFYISMVIIWFLGYKLPAGEVYQGKLAKENFPSENISIAIPKNAEHFRLFTWENYYVRRYVMFSFKASESEVQQWLASNPLGFDEYENYFTFEDAKAAAAELETLDREGRNELRRDDETTAIDEAIIDEAIIEDSFRYKDRPLWWPRDIVEQMRYDIVDEDDPFGIFIIYIEPIDEDWVKVYLYGAYDYRCVYD